MTKIANLVTGLCLGVTTSSLLVWPVTASAQPSCVWTDLMSDQVQAATVVPGAPRVRFVGGSAESNSATCPGTGKACQTRAFVVPGDTVLTGLASGPYTCAGFVDTGGRHMTIDWLPTASLRALPPAAPDAVDWTGHWVAPAQDITIKKDPDGTLSVHGDATWGESDPERVKNGGVHTGTVDGAMRPANGVLAFTQADKGTLPYAQGEQDDCRVRMVRRGPYLLAKDDNNCGGANVTFSGFYARKK